MFANRLLVLALFTFLGWPQPGGTSLPVITDPGVTPPRGAPGGEGHRQGLRVPPSGSPGSR